MSGVVVWSVRWACLLKVRCWFECQNWVTEKMWVCGCLCVGVLFNCGIWNEILAMSLPSLHRRNAWKRLAPRKTSLGFSVDSAVFANNMIVKLYFSPFKAYGY